MSIIKEFINFDKLAIWVWCKNYGELRFEPCKYCNCDFIGMVRRAYRKAVEEEED